MGRLSLNKKYITNINASASGSETYIFLGGSNNTIGTFLSDAETTFGPSGTGTEIIIYNTATQSFLTYLRRTVSSWRDANNTTVNNLVINEGTIFIIRSPTITKNFTMQGTNLVQKYSNLGKVLLNKPNQTILKPYSLDAGITTYDSKAVYIFQGGSINTISTVFNYLQLTGGTITTADYIFINSTVYYYKTSGLGGTGWRDTTSSSINRANTVINIGDLIYFSPRSYKEISVATGTIIQKLYNGKLSLNKISAI